MKGQPPIGRAVYLPYHTFLQLVWSDASLVEIV